MQARDQDDNHLEVAAIRPNLEVKSREEAIAWTKRFPNPSIDAGDAEIEVREYYELDDFGDSPEIERFRKIGIGE